MIKMARLKEFFIMEGIPSTKSPRAIFSVAKTESGLKNQLSVSIT